MGQRRTRRRLLIHPFATPHHLFWIDIHVPCHIYEVDETCILLANYGQRFYEPSAGIVLLFSLGTYTRVKSQEWRKWNLCTS